ncbi:MAG: DUF3307 domain-containing protein [Elusimicrobia bacterium]|nr:DUF3307 domain-containing protein [Elusimicrobiota bacterium]
MDSVIRLFLAHFIADFPLQFDFIFRLKKKGFWGCFVHSLIHVIVVIFLFLGDLKQFSFWLYVAILLFLHSFQDWGKIKLWKRPEDDKILFFAADQILHYLYIFAALLFPFAKNYSYYGSIFPSDFLMIYNDSGVINTISAAILAGWGGVILLFYLDKSLYGVEPETLNRFERSYGVIERIITVFFIMEGSYFIWFIPVLFLIRLSGLKNQPLYRGIMSLVFASVVGIGVSMINGFFGL